MTQITKKDKDTYHIEGFGNYRTGGKDLTYNQEKKLLQKLRNSGLVDSQTDTEFTMENLLKDTGLHESFKIYYRRNEGKDYEGTTEELVDDYKQLMRDYEFNLSSLGTMAVKINSYTEDEKFALAHMINKWEKTSGFVDGTMDGLVDIAQSIGTDYANLINFASFGTGFFASLAARKTAQAGVKHMLSKYTRSGLIQGAINGTAYAGLDNVARQNIHQSIGKIDEFDVENFLFTLGIGSVAGGALGGVLGKTVQTAKDSEKIMNAIKKTGDSKLVKSLSDKQKKTVKAAAESKISDLSSKNAIKYVEDQIKITLLKKSEGLSGQQLKKARAEARKEFKSNMSVETKDWFENTGIIDLGINPKTIEQKVLDMDNYLNKLNLDDVTDIDHIIKRFGQQKGLAAKGKYGEAHAVFVNIMQKQTHADLIAAKANPEANKIPFKILNERHTKMLLVDESEATAAGRMLILRKKLLNGGSDERFDSIATQNEWLDKFSDFENIDQVKKYLNDTDNLWKSGGRMLINAPKELFIHNILGGFGTISANVFGSFTHVIDRTATRYIGGVLSGDKYARIKATNEFKNLYSSLSHSLKASAKAINESKNQIDNRWMRDDYAADDVVIGTKESPIYKDGKFLPGWYSDGNAVFGSQVAGGLLNVMGNAIRLIGRRGIIGTDEFVKQLAFRSHIRSLATDEIIKKHKIKPNDISANKIKELSDEIEERAKLAITDQLYSSSKGLDPSDILARKAIAEARVGVFQDDPYQYAGKQIIGADIAMWSSRKLQDAKRSESVFNVNQGTNLLDFVVPFVRTPANLISYVVERTPGLQLASEKFGAKLKAGGSQAQEAHAALNMGIAMWSIALMWGMNNLIEGEGGDSNTARNRSLVRERTLNIPRHSILVGNKRINIRRLDPYARFTGIVGNMMDVYKYGDKKTNVELFASLVVSAGTSFLDMPTLTGLKNLTDIKDFESFGKFSGKLGASMIPFYRLYNEILGDERTYKEINNGVDAIKKNAFGFFEDQLDYARDPIFGQYRNYAADFPMPAFSYQDAENLDDVLFSELNRIGFAKGKPGHMDGQIDLRKYRGKDFGGTNKRSFYDEYQELCGTIKIQGKTLKETLTKEVQTYEYLQMSDPVKGFENTAPRGKYSNLSSIIDKFRQKAKIELYKKYPKFYGNKILPTKLAPKTNYDANLERMKEKINRMKK